MVRVKICGLALVEDVERAVEYGADALGFVMEPSSPRCALDREEMKRLLHTPHSLGPYSPPRVMVYGKVTAPPPWRYDFVQAYEFASPTPIYGKVLTVRPAPNFDPDSLLELVDLLDPWALNVDAFDPKRAGGTGKRVDLSFVRKVAGIGARPLVVAGGLTPDNVAEVVRQVRPYAVDVSTGVESSPGCKDPIKVRDFIQAAKGA